MNPRTTPRFQRYITVVLLLTVPATAFGQINVDQRQLERIRARLSDAPVVVDWDRYRDRLELVVQDACDDAKRRGRLDAADQHRGRGWWWSTGVGFFLPIIGIGIASGAAALSKPQPNTLVADLDQRCYRDGYGAAARKKNFKIALAGSVLGTTLLALLIVAAGGFAVFPSAP